MSYGKAVSGLERSHAHRTPLSLNQGDSATGGTPILHSHVCQLKVAAMIQPAT